MNNISIGKFGEKTAKEFLQKNNFLILDTNLKNKLGEIDIVAVKNKRIHFIEVKTRSINSPEKPYEAINYKKINKIYKTGITYIKDKNISLPYQIDVISIEINFDLSINKLKYF